MMELIKQLAWTNTCLAEEEIRFREGVVNGPCAGELIKFSGGRENDNGDLGVAENGQFLGFFEEAIASLGEGDLPAIQILYLLHLYFPSSHLLLSFSVSPTHIRFLFLFFSADYWIHQHSDFRFQILILEREIYHHSLLSIIYLFIYTKREIFTDYRAQTPNMLVGIGVLIVLIGERRHGRKGSPKLAFQRERPLMQYYMRQSSSFGLSRYFQHYLFLTFGNLFRYSFFYCLDSIPKSQFLFSFPFSIFFGKFFINYYRYSHIFLMQNRAFPNKKIWYFFRVNIRKEPKKKKETYYLSAFQKS